MLHYKINHKSSILEGNLNSKFSSQPSILDIISYNLSSHIFLQLTFEKSEISRYSALFKFFYSYFTIALTRGE